MNFLPTNPNFFFEKEKRKKFSDNEIFYNTFFLMKQTRYSNKLDYFHFKGRKNNMFLTKIKNCCILSGKFRSVNARLKLSHIKLSRQIDTGSLVGFYRALW
jgi:ribosomal protein S14